MKHQEGSFAMQHHSQRPANGSTTGILVNDGMISSDAIERHIAEGKRLQAEAIAAFLRGCVARVGAAFHRPQAGETANNGAVAHQA